MKIIIPNAAIGGGSITNYTVLGTRRVAVNVGVEYGADIDQVEQIILDAVKDLPGVLAEPAPAVAFVDMAASSLDFTAFVHTSVEDWLPTHGAVRKAIYNALNEAGIDIPFQQVVVHRAATAAAAEDGALASKDA